MNRLKTKLGKLEFKNPITTASGTFDLEYAKFIDIEKLGAVVTKTITKNPKKGNKPPRICETSNGFLNSIGLQNPGLDSFIKNTIPKYEKYNVPLIVSFSGSTTNEFVEILQKLEEVERIDGYEVNVSCPNVENEGMAFGTDSKIVEDLTKQLADLTDKELIIKLSPNVTDIGKIARAAQKGGADSLALINTLLGMAVDWETGKSKISRIIAGYSGPAIKPVALQNLFKVRKAVDIPILGMGGISDWHDALEYFYTGANLIAIGTANFSNPRSTMDILDNLEKYFSKNDLKLKNIINTLKV